MPKIDVSNEISKEELIEIQTEAYYKALKRIEDEKKGKLQKESTQKKKYTWIQNILFLINVLFWPWKINITSKVNNRMYDGILVLFVSMILYFLGFVAWILGLVMLGYNIYCVCTTKLMNENVYTISIGMLTQMFGSMFILAGKEFGKETDSNKIYGYSASIIAMISCVIAFVALILQLK